MVRTTKRSCGLGALWLALAAAAVLIFHEGFAALGRAWMTPEYSHGPLIPAISAIRLDSYELHVAEACSGLCYLFSVMSFTYVFAVLHRGPAWHKAALLLAAVPITIAMNAARIGVMGIVVDRFGIAHAEGFMHAFEGWAVFLIVIALMIGLSAALPRLRGDRSGLVNALDLGTRGAVEQILRVSTVRPSGALLGVSAVLALAGGLTLEGPGLGLPAEPRPIQREPFALFPHALGSWETTSEEILDPTTMAALAAGDYLSRRLRAPRHGAEVDLFIAWYRDQSRGGVHSPEICIPGSGWEVARIETIAASVATPDGASQTITLNRTVIQKGIDRQLAYYWFDQRGRRIASDYLAKLHLVLDAARTERSDGALVRMITPIRSDETEQVAESRLRDLAAAVMPILPNFVATDWPD